MGKSKIGMMFGATIGMILVSVGAFTATRPLSINVGGTNYGMDLRNWGGNQSGWCGNGPQYYGPFFIVK